MNKQQLAAKIWESANQMRSKIEANEYKDYILGFIFYKYLSDKELKFTKKEGFSDNDIKSLAEEDTETVEHIKSNVGYFIAYEHLFSTWITMGKDFGVSNLRDALSSFSRLIHPVHKKLFDGVFDTLQTGLSKLGDSSQAQTSAISQLIQLIKRHPYPRVETWATCWRICKFQQTGGHYVTVRRELRRVANYLHLSEIAKKRNANLIVGS